MTAAVIKRLTSQQEDEKPGTGEIVMQFCCPGCDRMHAYRIQSGCGAHPNIPVWNWNGDLVKPTFTPSLMVDRGTPRQCHLYVTNGLIRFCTDSRHELAGKTVDMAPVDDD